MTFDDLVVGDHFIWLPTPGSPAVDAVNVNINIASGENGGGFAIDLVTRLDSISPVGQIVGEPPAWIPGTAPVIKLNGHL